MNRLARWATRRAIVRILKKLGIALSEFRNVKASETQHGIAMLLVKGATLAGLGPYIQSGLDIVTPLLQKIPGLGEVDPTPEGVVAWCIAVMILRFGYKAVRAVPAGPATEEKL